MSSGESEVSRRSVGQKKRQKDEDQQKTGGKRVTKETSIGHQSVIHRFMFKKYTVCDSNVLIRNTLFI